MHSATGAISSPWFQSVFIDGCSAVSCGFVVFMRGGELKVLLCHVDKIGLFIFLLLGFKKF